MKDPELSAKEEARLDYLMDAQNRTADEARKYILAERRMLVGAGAVAETSAKKPTSTERPKQKHPSRRGGRSFPEPSDSELDPYWNGK
jgi:hypothetical protein